MQVTDDYRHALFTEVVAAFDLRISGDYSATDRAVALEQALATVHAYQTYLRGRVASLGDNLRTFRENFADLLLELESPDERALWQRMNGATVLLDSHGQNFFNAPRIQMFLRSKEDRATQIERMLQREIADIRLSHGPLISAERRRALLIERAHTLVVEQELLQFCLETTMLTRWQLTAISELRRLSHYTRRSLA